MIKITEIEAVEMFDEILDSCEPTIEVCGIQFLPSQILRECDPVAYRCCFLDYCDTISDEYEIEEKA